MDGKTKAPRFSPFRLQKIPSPRPPAPSGSGGGGNPVLKRRQTELQTELQTEVPSISDDKRTLLRSSATKGGFQHEKTAPNPGRESPRVDLDLLALDLWDLHRPKYPVRYNCTFELEPGGGAIASAADQGFTGHVTINTAHPDLRHLCTITTGGQRLAVAVAAVLLFAIPRLPRNGPFDIPVGKLDLRSAEQVVNAHIDTTIANAIVEADAVITNARMEVIA